MKLPHASVAVVDREKITARDKVRGLAEHGISAR